MRKTRKPNRNLSEVEQLNFLFTKILSIRAKLARFPMSARYRIALEKHLNYLETIFDNKNGFKTC